MHLYKFAVAATLPLVLGTHAFTDVRSHWVQEIAVKNNVTADAEGIPTAFFDQYIDHDDHSKGTFKQRYYYSTRYYKGPGSPVVLTTPGESSLSFSQFFFHKNTITGKFAEAVGAAIVIVEHRYWGESKPYEGQAINAETLQDLTLKNALQDFVNFAQNAKLPFDEERKSQPKKAAWIFSGGSYAGALSAWTEQLYPGTFWAYHASSAVVQAVYDFWRYWYIVENNGMPNQCAKDTELAVNYMDGILQHGTPKQKLDLKSFFNLGNLTHDDDFAYALAYNLFTWQSLPDPYFCQKLAQGKTTIKPDEPPVKGILRGWKDYTKHRIFCFDNCWNTHRGSRSAFLIAGRTWGWMLCNEPFAWWMSSGPAGQQGIILEALTADYSQRQCANEFPTVNGYTYGSNRGKTVQDTNAYTKGWNRRPSKRLMWSNSGKDPWRAATVSSPYRPGGPQVSTEEEPIFFTYNGYHIADFTTCSEKSTLAVCKTVNKEVELMKQWVAEFPKQ